MLPYILVSNTIMKNFIAAEKHCPEMGRIERMMFLGISSIERTRPFAYTTSDMIKARTFGFLTPKDMQDYYNVPGHESFRSLYDKYTTRRRYEYMMKDLKAEGLIGEVPYKRRTVVSLRIKDDLELLTRVSASSKSNRRREVTEKLKAAQEQFRQNQRAKAGHSDEEPIS